MLTIEEQKELIKLCQDATERMKQITADLAKAELALKAQNALLESSNQLIKCLTDFIRKNGLEPPIGLVKLQEPDGGSYLN